MLVNKSTNQLLTSTPRNKEEFKNLEIQIQSLHKRLMTIILPTSLTHSIVVDLNSPIFCIFSDPQISTLSDHICIYHGDMVTHRHDFDKSWKSLFLGHVEKIYFKDCC